MRPADNGDGWISQIARATITGYSQFPTSPLLDKRGIVHDQVAIARDAYGSGATAEEALADLEYVLRTEIAGS